MTQKTTVKIDRTLTPGMKQHLADIRAMRAAEATLDEKEVFKRPAKTPDEASQYDALLTAVKKRFTSAVVGRKYVFTTDAVGLWYLYLSSLPETGGFRQRHNCHACKSFIEKYGGLVSIDPEFGTQTPLFWAVSKVPGVLLTPYDVAFTALAVKVRRAKVTGVFFSGTANWGNPVTNHKSVYHHLAVDAVDLRDGSVSDQKDAAQTPGQLMADYHERYNTVQHALADTTVNVLKEAVCVFESEALYRSEKFLEPVKWLLDRKRGQDNYVLGEPWKIKRNLLWSAVAEAPVGFTHPRASVIWPLLEDIKAGTPFDEMKRKFHAMVAPLQYQRLQAAPSEGTVKQAEVLFEKMGLAPALERRFARLEDIIEHAVWTPASMIHAAHCRVSSNAACTCDGVDFTSKGVFAHLDTKNSRKTTVPQVDLPVKVVTLEKFMRDVIPEAEQLELNAPNYGRYSAMTTAVHADAPQILKWSNPVAWYVYVGGSAAAQWGLHAGWVPVTAIVPAPTVWDNKSPTAYLNEGLVLVLQGCADYQTGQGNALFPECLKSELHGVRSVIEAYSRRAELQGHAEASACGYDLRRGACDCRVRALKDSRWTEYQIDCWE